MRRAPALLLMRTTAFLLGETTQAAVDAAAPGDTIIVAGGVHTEQVVIDKDLALRGAAIGLRAGTRPG